jgi:hypothetical protein
VKASVRTRYEARQAWIALHPHAAANGSIVVNKDQSFPHPRDAGALPTTTWPVGQLADYVLEFGAGVAPLLVREFHDRFEVFLAGVQLTKKIFKFIEDNPESAGYVGGVLFGALAGAAISRSRNGALLGAGIGLLLVALAKKRTAEEITAA